MLDSGSEDYERQILEVASSLGRDLGIELHPKRVVWYGRSVAAPNFMKGLGSDQCDFDGGDVKLPKALKDKLTSLEWRPILASQIIYERRSKLSILARWLISVPLLIFLWVPTVAILGASYGDNGMALAVFLLIPITILATWFFSHELRSVRLKADEKAASIVGPREFLNVLEKVDSYHIKDVERRKRGGFRITISSHFPAIDARMRHIRRLTEP